MNSTMSDKPDWISTTIANIDLMERAVATDGIRLQAYRDLRRVFEQGCVQQSCRESAWQSLALSETSCAERRLFGSLTSIGEELKLLENRNKRTNPFLFGVQSPIGAQIAASAGDGAVRLPFPSTAWEFAFSGRRFTLLMRSCDEKQVEGTLYFKASAGWYWLGDGFIAPADLRFSHTGDALDPFVNRLIACIRGLAIMLDAEAATIEVHRAPHRLNHAREKRGDPPLRDFHTLVLANRHRVPPRLPEPGDLEEEKRRPPRLHFVRGHYVHFQNWKTWRKWHFRGDPDLGFVDKDYRL